jgi:galactokinase
MDQYAAACSRPGHALFLDCRSRTGEHVPVPADDLAVVVVDTTVSHDIAESAYGDRVRECRAAATELSTVLGRPVATLRDVTAEEVTAHAASLPEPERSRAAHVTSENDRVLAARDALGGGVLERLGGLVSASHASLRDDFAVSCPELDRVVTAAETVEGVYGARMTGGGFGGSVVVLARPGATGAVARAVATEFDGRGDPDPDVHATSTGHGVEVRRVDE